MGERKKLVVTFYFEEVVEDGYKFIDYEEMEVSGNLTPDERQCVAESWSQSDGFRVDIVNELLENIDG